MRAIIANFLRGLLAWLATENVNNQLGKLGLFTPGHLLESTTKPPGLSISVVGECVYRAHARFSEYILVLLNVELEVEISICTTY